MFNLSELNKLKRTRDKRAIPTVALYLNKNNEYTRKYEVFESRREASNATGVHTSDISNIINQRQYYYTATHRNGQRVTFVNADATQKEINEHLKRVKEVEHNPSPVSVKILYLDENKKYTGEYEIFTSEAEASEFTGVTQQSISSIIHQIKHYYTSTHKINGRRVTFVNANATQKEIYKHLKRIKEIENDTSPISVKMIYLDENNEPIGEYEIFTSETEASKFTGVTQQSISSIIHQIKHRYTSTHKINGRRVTFVNTNATQEEIKKHIQRITNRYKQAI